jgi:hypothetical protein
MKSSNTNRNGADSPTGAHQARSFAYREDGFEPLLNSEDAALLKIHPKALQKLASNGEVDAIQIENWSCRKEIFPAQLPSSRPSRS